jgi:hypothetical protein
MNIFTNVNYDLLNLIINFLTAIGTISAVVVAMTLALKRTKDKAKVSYDIENENFMFKIDVSISNMNVERPIYLNECKLFIDDKLMLASDKFHLDNKRYHHNESELEAVYGLTLHSYLKLQHLFEPEYRQFMKAEHIKSIDELKYEKAKICVHTHGNKYFCLELSDSDLTKMKEYAIMYTQALNSKGDNNA